MRARRIQNDKSEDCAGERLQVLGDVVNMAHGGGGSAMRLLLDEVVFPSLGSDSEAGVEDAALLDLPAGKIAFSTDSYVVSPLFFPGGDIGKLAVCGTINDLSMRGAKPLWLSLGLIIEEGFSIGDLKKILTSVREIANETGVRIIAGDTKVVERGKADGIYINTSGVGTIQDDISVGITEAKKGDVLIVNGHIGDHGIAIITQREDFPFDLDVVSDCAPLSGLVELMLSSGEVHSLRDPTRGGLASALNEMAAASGCSIVVEERNIPVRDEVRGVCEALGLDPINVANEGKLVAAVSARDAEAIVSAMRKHRYGVHSCIIGEVVDGYPGDVSMVTRIGSRRLIRMPSGEQLPRIC